MKIFNRIVIVGCLFGLTSMFSCSSDSEYDDTKISQQISSNASKIEALESSVKKLNSDLSNVKTIVSALQSHIYVSSVTKVSEGWLVLFTDGNSVTLRNGEDGSDNIDGKDSVIGVKEYYGVYYWTITIDGRTEWILDENGRKVPVKGTNGTNGKDGVAGEDGSDGATPTLRVSEEGFLQVSYDDINYYNVEDGQGNAIYVVGGSSSNDALVKNVTISEGNVTVVLVDGITLQLPRITDFYINIEGLNQEVFTPGKTVVLPFTITGADTSTFVVLCPSGNVEVSLDYEQGASQGNISITTTGKVDKYTKVMVFICNEKETIGTIIR